MTILVRASLPSDGDRIVEIWRDAVDATHDFLAPHDRIAIEQDVRAHLPRLPMWLAVDADDRPLAFMLLGEAHIDALFVDPAARGTGIGRLLVDLARSLAPVLTTDVNAQNEQALGFYRRLGFAEAGRADLDGQGRPYPLIHLRLDSTAR
jgi:putative acetyltransferase